MAAGKIGKAKKENSIQKKEVKSVFGAWLKKCFIGVEEKNPVASEDIVEAYTKGLSQFVQFGGRTCRYDYFGFMIFHILFGSVLFYIALTSGFAHATSLAGFIWGVPLLAIWSRRLHDVNLSFLLFGVFPIGGVFSLVYWLYIKSVRQFIDTVGMAHHLTIFLWLYLLIVTAKRGCSEGNVFGNPIIEDKSHCQRVKWMIFFNVLLQLPLIFAVVLCIFFIFPWYW